MTDPRFPYRNGPDSSQPVGGNSVDGGSPYPNYPVPLQPVVGQAGAGPTGAASTGAASAGPGGGPAVPDPRVGAGTHYVPRSLGVDPKANRRGLIGVAVVVGVGLIALLLGAALFARYLVAGSDPFSVGAPSPNQEEFPGLDPGWSDEDWPFPEEGLGSETGSWEISVVTTDLDAEERFSSGYEYAELPAGYKLVGVEVELTNVGSSSADPYIDLIFSLTDAATGQTYIDDLLLMGPGALFDVTNVDPGQDARAWVIFPVPESFTEGELEVAWWSESGGIASDRVPIP